MSNNSTADNYILTRQIKLTIQKYYTNLNQNQLAQKVRTEIIPLLITLFFQTDVRSSKKLLGSTKQLVNSLNNLLQEKENINVIGDGKNNINVSIGNGKYKKLFNQGELIGEERKECIKNIKMNQFMNNNASVEDLIYRALALCKLANSIENLRKKRENQEQIFIIYKQSKIKKIKAIKWLQKCVSLTQRRKILSKFYLNYHTTKRQIQTCRAIHKLYILKINNYYSTFKHNTIHRHLQSEDYQTKKWEQYKSTVFQRGFNKLHKIYQSNIWKALNKVKLYNFMGNPWRTKWVRSIVFKTPANLQTSLWRLKNYVKNQEIKKQELSMLQISSFQVQTQPFNCPDYQQDENNLQKQNSLFISKITKKNLNNVFIPPILQVQKSFSRQQSAKKILQAVQSASDKSQLQAILFTPQQKAKILTQQLQYIYGLISMQNMIEAFSQIELYQSPKQKTQKKCQQSSSSQIETQAKMQQEEKEKGEHKQIIQNALRTSILLVQSNLLKDIQQQYIKQQQSKYVQNIIAESISKIQQNLQIDLIANQIQIKQQKTILKNAINQSLKTIQNQLIQKQQIKQCELIQNTVGQSIKNIEQLIIDRRQEQQEKQQQQDRMISNTISQSLKNIGYQIVFTQQNQENQVVHTIVSENLMEIGQNCSNKIIGSDFMIDEPIQENKQVKTNQERIISSKNNTVEDKLQNQKVCPEIQKTDVGIQEEEKNLQNDENYKKNSIQNEKQKEDGQENEQKGKENQQ